MLMVDRAGTPLSAYTHSAGVAEVHGIEALVARRRLPQAPDHLLYDKAADADWLRDALQAQGVELVCPLRFRSAQSLLEHPSNGLRTRKNTGL